MPKPAIQLFEQALIAKFNTYLKQKPTQVDSFDGAMKRILWMKETVQKVNEESSTLIKQYAGDDSELQKEMQSISLKQTKELMATLKA